jgi:hypothetical protein
VGASSPSTGAFTTLSATTPLAVASGGTGVTTSTGTTNVVLSGSPTITTPVIAQINDASGNETLKLASIASAVNEISIENAATGNPVHIRASGGDASIGLHLVAKGSSGYVNVTDGVDETKRLMFNAAGGTTNTRTMLSSTQTVDRTISLPDATDTLVGRATTDTLTNKTLTSPTMTAPVLGTPASGTVTNLTGTASININGTVGATTANTGAFSTLSATTSGSTSTITLTDTGASGANFKFVGDGATTPNKYIRAQGGQLQFLNSAYSAAIATLTDAGSFSAVGGINSTAMGATVPSTGAFTTLGASGTSTLFFTQISTSDQSNCRLRFINTGSGGQTWDIIGGTNGASNVGLGFLNGSTTYMQLTTAGAAITGTITSTGNMSVTGNGGFYNSGSAPIGFSSDTAASGNTYLDIYRVLNIRNTNASYATLGQWSATGLSITGTLSATGTITSSSPASTNSTTFRSEGYIANGAVDTRCGTIRNQFDTNTGYSTFWTAKRLAGGSGYQMILGTAAGAGDVDIAVISSTGLAVTGNLSATGTSTLGAINSSGAITSTVAGAGFTATTAGITTLISSNGGAFVGTTSAHDLQLIRNSSTIGTFSATGLAVTGLISATTTVKATTEFHAVSPTNTGSASFRSAFTTCGVDLANSTDTSGVAFINFRKADSTAIGSINRVALTNAVVYNTTSDARFKENFRDFTDSGRLIDALKPRVFDWKDSDSNGKDVIGFVAQEEHAADPIFAHIGAVSVGDDDPTTITKQWQRSDAALIPILVAELQSLRKRLAALESK